MMAIVDVEKNRASVRRWYRNNAEEYNAKRREKYRKNPALRKAARERAKAYRESKRSGGPEISRELTRTIDGVSVPVFSTGMIAQKVGCSPQLVRSWQSRGWIPETTIEGKHRLFTSHQVILIQKLYKFVYDNGGPANVDRAKLAEELSRISGAW